MILYQVRGYHCEMDLEGPWVSLEGRRVGATQIYYQPTQEDALRLAKRWWTDHFGPKGDFWDTENWVKVTKVGIENDKEGVVAMLNNTYEYLDIGAVRVWDFNHQRGAKPGA